MTLDAFEHGGSLTAFENCRRISELEDCTNNHNGKYWARKEHNNVKDEKIIIDCITGEDIESVVKCNI